MRVEFRVVPALDGVEVEVGDLERDGWMAMKLAQNRRVVRYGMAGKNEQSSRATVSVHLGLV